MNLDVIKQINAGQTVNMLLGEQLNVVPVDSLVQFALAGAVRGGASPDAPTDLTVNIFSGSDLVVQGGYFNTEVGTADTDAATMQAIPPINAESYIYQDAALQGDKLGVFVTNGGSKTAFARVSIVVTPQ